MYLFETTFSESYTNASKLLFSNTEPFIPPGDSTCGQRAIYHSLGLTGIPIINVNNNCSTGSTALFMARQLVLGGELAPDPNMDQGWEIPARLRRIFGSQTSVISPKWSNLTFPSLVGLADCVLALGFEKMERGSLSAKV